MFDIAPDDINQLNDSDLRELIGRLCEAELANRGLSPSAVTWGGNQTAPDGGLDVRVELPAGVAMDGFIPRSSTGFQVKKPDMPRARIIEEMRPGGTIRPVIQELADSAGAYIMISSAGSTADVALRNRRDALREALDGVANAGPLHTDFYDRTRLATWARRHPGVITWVKERVGKALIGWRPYGSWSNAAEEIDADYLLDDKLRLHIGKQRDSSTQPLAHAIDELRDELAQPGKAVRLVGLSGVGKTRLVQALFDARIGSRSLPPSLAVYADLSDNPDPQPTGLASDLMANRMRAILIVDNCPPDLHRRLADLCNGERSTISVLTVEYDVREDQPEGTQVVTLDTSSPELIEKLIRCRYPHISPVDARTIADASGGNARIAIALAETVERSETIAGLSNDELFQRLFRQRHDPNDDLLLAAQACSLVYSFQGEALSGEEAELPRLAILSGQVPAETYRHVGELLRRDLVQQRGFWRAVLPHAIANRLAARALEDTPYDLINQQLIESGTERLAKSFSRRLSFLHDHPKAVAIVEKWLAPGGLLGDVTTLNDLGQAMLQNVAPVQPEAALAALERAGNCQPEAAAKVWWHYLSLLRALAYDPSLFGRSTQVLVRAATQGTDERKTQEASDIFLSLFTIHLSGTHATIDQRLDVIEQLLSACEDNVRALGLAALSKVLETTHFISSYRFEFGARSRDYGYQPRSDSDVHQWYSAALTLMERLFSTEERLKPQLRNLLAEKFRGLWTSAHMHNELEKLCRGFTADEFWRKGWVACRQTIQFDKDRLAPEAAARLSALAADLGPSSLKEQVQAVVLGNNSDGPDLEDMDADGDVNSSFRRLEATAHKLGAAVADDETVLKELLLDLLQGGHRAWSFGRGLASASPDPCATWTRLVEGLKQVAPGQRNVQILRGFLAELWDHNRDLAQYLLDSALDQPALLEFLPVLSSAPELDERGVERLKQVLNAGQVPVWAYRNLAFGRTTDHLEGRILRDLLLLIVDQPDGFDVALEILYMRLYSDRSAQKEHEPELLKAGQELIRRVTFLRENNQHRDYRLASVVKACLALPNSDRIAADVAVKLRHAIATYATPSFDNHGLLTALLEVQPVAVLDILFSGDDKEQQAGVEVFKHIGGHQSNPANVISCEALISWCEGDCENRYPLAASIITFARCSEAAATLAWSEQAKALLANTPDPKGMLEVFIKRFRPMSWSGSRAALIEANARLLDSLEFDIPSSLMLFLNEAKTQLAQEVVQERQWETEQDRALDERFE